MTTTIRVVVRDDVDPIKALAVGNRMFGADEVGFFDEMIGGFVDGDLPDDRWLIAERGGSVAGAAYVAPEPFGDRVWNLYFLATDSSIHGSGIGTLLMADVESHLRDLGPDLAQVLIVETSDTDQYIGARRFYEHQGFDRESTIRDYYGVGDDKVTYWKALNR